MNQFLFIHFESFYLPLSHPSSFVVSLIFLSFCFAPELPSRRMWVSKHCYWWATIFHKVRQLHSWQESFPVCLLETVTNNAALNFHLNGTIHLSQAARNPSLNVFLSHTQADYSQTLIKVASKLGKGETLPCDQLVEVRSVGWLSQLLKSPAVSWTDPSTLSQSQERAVRSRGHTNQQRIGQTSDQTSGGLLRALLPVRHAKNAPVRICT